MPLFTVRGKKQRGPYNSGWTSQGIKVFNKIHACVHWDRETNGEEFNSCMKVKIDNDSENNKNARPVNSLDEDEVVVAITDFELPSSEDLQGSETFLTLDDLLLTGPRNLVF